MLSTVEVEKKTSQAKLYVAVQYTYNTNGIHRFTGTHNTHVYTVCVYTIHRPGLYECHNVICNACLCVWCIQNLIGKNELIYRSFSFSLLFTHFPLFTFLIFYGYRFFVCIHWCLRFVFVFIYELKCTYTGARYTVSTKMHNGDAIGSNVFFRCFLCRFCYDFFQLEQLNCSLDLLNKNY